MATLGEGLGSPAIEQDPSVAQIQAQQLGAQSAETVGLPATGFVGSINNLSGLLTLTGSANISVTDDGVSNFTFTLVGVGQQGLAKSNITAAAPTPGNDESEGYSIYSIWIDNTIPATPDVYICASNAPMAAVWVKLN